MTASDRSDDVASLLRSATVRLSAAGVASPRVDAELLLAHAAGVDRAEITRAAIIGHMVSELFPDSESVGPGVDAAAVSTVRTFEEALTRRCSREPLQHILGVAPFRHLELQVGPGVFVPRPETEVVAQVAIDEAADVAARTGRVVVADLCAGSGAIALAVASEVNGAQVYAVELDVDAFEWLIRNVLATFGEGASDGTGPLSNPRVPGPERALPAQGSGNMGRVRAVRGDARRALLELDGRCDVVVSNPPYVPPNATPRDEEVAGYDPGVALFGLGADGFEVPRGIIVAAARLLRPGGLFVMEHAEVQGAVARAAVHGSGAFTEVSTGLDLTGRERMVTARRAGLPDVVVGEGRGNSAGSPSSRAQQAPDVGDSKS